MSNEELVELGTRLGAISEQYRQQMDDLARSMAAVFAPIEEAQATLAKYFSESIASALSQFAAIDWEDVHRRMVACCDKLAGLGWTLPMTFTPRQMVELVEHGSSDAEIEQYVVDYLAREENSPFGLRGPILSSECLKPWRGLLEECFAAYERKHFRIAIPALLAVIEGAVTHNAGKLTSGKTKPARLAADLESAAPERSMERMIWHSIRIVMDHLFADSPFGGPHPGRLNRHWVLHGRDQSEWTQADALRLFNLLATLA